MYCKSLAKDGKNSTNSSNICLEQIIHAATLATDVKGHLSYICLWYLTLWQSNIYWSRFFVIAMFTWLYSHVSSFLHVMLYIKVWFIKKIQFRYCERPQSFWKYLMLLLSMVVQSNIKLRWEIFNQSLWYSHNIWALPT